MEEITKLLYWISTGMLVPVIVLLLIFFVRALILIGIFYGTYIHKVKHNKLTAELFQNLNSDNVYDLTSKLPGEAKLLFSVYLNKAIVAPVSDIHYNKLLNDFEIVCQHDLSGSQTLAKLGPILGLMGTLIPMGPALVGLASGDIASMASNMQVAFATTVIGLIIGAVGFIILQIKRRWFASDINNLEFIIELLKTSPKN